MNSTAHPHLRWRYYQVVVGEGLSTVVSVEIMLFNFSHLYENKRKITTKCLCLCFVIYLTRETLQSTSCVCVCNGMKSHVSKRMIPVSTMVNVWQEFKVCIFGRHLSMNFVQYYYYSRSTEQNDVVTMAVMVWVTTTPAVCSRVIKV